jgi:hypothetical protein
MHVNCNIMHLLGIAKGSLCVYLLTQCSRVLLGKLIGFKLVKKFPKFYETRMFITAFTSTRHLSLPSVQFWGFLCKRFITKILFHEEFLAPRPPQAWGPPLVGRPRLLIQYIRSNPPYWRLFLHTQPYDAPCGDRDPLITEKVFVDCNKIS